MHQQEAWQLQAMHTQRRGDSYRTFTTTSLLLKGIIKGCGGRLVNCQQDKKKQYRPDNFISGVQMFRSSSMRYNLLSTR